MAQKRTPIKGLGDDSFYSGQLAVEPVAQHASKPVETLVKVTVYLTPDHVEKLEDVRYKRRKAGEKVDKSQLVREAIDQLAS